MSHEPLLHRSSSHTSCVRGFVAVKRQWAFCWGGGVGLWGLYRECYVACMTWHVSEAGGGLDLWPRAPKLGRWKKGIGWEGFASKQGLLFRPLQECQFHKKMPAERKRQRGRKKKRYLTIYLPTESWLIPHTPRCTDSLSYLVNCGPTALIINCDQGLAKQFAP